MKKIFCIILVLAVTGSAFALEIEGKAPAFKTNDPLLIGSVAELNSQLQNAYDEAKDELNKQIGGIGPKPEEFIKAWGDSAVFASHGATTRAFGDYKDFSITAGPMIGVKLPGSVFDIEKDLDGLTEKLNKDKDLKLGVNPQVMNVRIGMNTSKFLIKNLYIGVHIGYMKLDSVPGISDEYGNGFSFSNFSLGATANYQLIQPKKMAGGLLLWRGLNVGSGLIYQNTKIGYTLPLESFEQELNSGSINGKFTFDPKVVLDMNVNTITVPIEATTAIRLLWFINIPVGAGVDIALGKSDLKIGMKGDINATTDNSNITQDKPGNLSVSAGGDMPPTFLNLKVMTGIGFTIGPVVIDVPVTFYVGNGYSVGLTFGAVW